MRQYRKHPSDLRGMKYGRLTVIEAADYDDFGHLVYKCRCSCGNTTYVARSNLTCGATKSCGCLRKELASATMQRLRPAADLTGRRFGRLVALRQVGRAGREQLWLCKCDCGENKEVRRGSLLKGSTKSCGCYGREYRRLTRAQKNEL